MSLRDRLRKCFLAVFPSLSAAEAEATSRDSLEAWDSLAGITLLSVIQEEFEVEIDILEWVNLDNFESVLLHLQSQGAA